MARVHPRRCWLNPNFGTSSLFAHCAWLLSYDHFWSNIEDTQLLRYLHHQNLLQMQVFHLVHHLFVLQGLASLRGIQGLGSSRRVGSGSPVSRGTRYASWSRCSGARPFLQRFRCLVEVDQLKTCGLHQPLWLPTVIGRDHGALTGNSVKKWRKSNGNVYQPKTHKTWHFTSIPGIMSTIDPAIPSTFKNADLNSQLQILPRCWMSKPEACLSISKTA